MAEIEDRLDVSAMIASVEPEFDRLRSTVQARVHSAIASRDTGQLITLKLRGSGKLIHPSPTPEYLRPLWDYLKGNTSVESAAVEGIALDAANKAIQEFYTSDATIEALGKELVRQLDTNQALRKALVGAIASNATWLRNEISSALSGSAKTAAGERILDAASHAMGAAMHTAGGQALAGLAAKALAVPAVKAALVKAIIAAAHSVVIQKAVVLAVKKVGVATLAQIFAAKLAAAGGGATIPGLGWIVTAAIGGLLVYDYQTLPAKLADKIAPELANTLSNKNNDLHRTMVMTFGRIALQEIKRQVSKNLT
jgi:hypothetical protein